MTPKMRKTEESRRLPDCTRIPPPSSSLSSTSSTVCKRDTSKRKTAPLSLVSCFSFGKMKAAQTANKPQGKKKTTPVTSNSKCAAHSSNPSRTTSARPYATIYPTSKLAVNDYVSAIYTRQPVKTPQHEYENIDEMMCELGLGYAPPPLARREDSISLSSRQYSPSFSSEPADLNDRIREMEREKDSAYVEEGSSATVKRSQITAISAFKSSQRTLSHHSHTIFPHPPPNISFISQASSLCSPDQLSTVSLHQAGRGGPLLHSTFNYPLHSTVVTENTDTPEAQDKSKTTVDRSPSFCATDYPFPRRGTQRWPSRAFSVGTALTTTKRPASLSGDTATLSKQQQRYNHCQNTRLNNMPSNTHVHQVMGGNSVFTATRARSVPGQSARCTIAASSMVTHDDSHPLQPRVHKTVNTHQWLQHSPCSKSSSNPHSGFLHRKNNSNGTPRHRLSSLAHHISGTRGTSENHNYQPTSHYRAPNNTAVEQQLPAHNESSSMQSVLQRQTSLLSQINQCLAPRLHRRYQQQQQADSLLSRASESTFCSVTHIDSGLFVSQNTTGNHWNDNDDAMSDNLTEGSGRRLVSRQQIDNGDLQTLTSSTRMQGVRGGVPGTQLQQRDKDDYESSADDFSRRLTLLVQSCPLVRTSTQRHLHSTTPLVRPLLATSSTCCDSHHVDQLILASYPQKEGDKLLRGGDGGTERGKKGYNSKVSEKYCDTRHSNKRQQLPTTKHYLHLINTQRVLLGYC